jgi:hypothetical protein
MSMLDSNASVLLILPHSWRRNNHYVFIVDCLKWNFLKVDILEDADFSSKNLLNYGYDLIVDCDSEKFGIPFNDLFEIYQKISSKKVLLTFDDEYMFGNTFAKAPFYDLILSTDYVSVQRLRQNGFKSKHWIIPLPIMPNEYENEFKYSISFIGRTGGVKSTRMRFINLLRKEFAGLNCYFPGEDSKLVSEDEMAQIIKSSKINLNFAGVSMIDPFFSYSGINFHSETMNGMKARPFEIGGYRSFCLSEYSVSLSKMLRKNVHLAYFDNNSDLIQKINYFLGRDTEREILANNLYQRTFDLCSYGSPRNALVRALSNLIDKKHSKKRPVGREFLFKRPDFLVYRYENENNASALSMLEKLNNLRYLHRIFVKNLFFTAGKIVKIYFDLFKLIVTKIFK